MKRIIFLLWITLTGSIVFGQTVSVKNAGNTPSAKTLKPTVLTDNELMSMANASTPGMAMYTKTVTPTQSVADMSKTNQPKKIEPTYLDAYLGKQSGPQHCQIYYATINVHHIWESTLGEVVYNKLLTIAEFYADEASAKEQATQATAEAMSKIANGESKIVVALNGNTYRLLNYQFSPMKAYIDSPYYSGTKAQFMFDYLEPANFGLDAINNKLHNYTDEDGTPSAKTFSDAYTLKTATINIHP